MRLHQWLWLALALPACGAEPDSASLVSASIESKEQFFSHERLYFVRIEGWNPGWMTPTSLSDYRTTPGAKLKIYVTPHEEWTHCPDGQGELVYESSEAFEVRTSGNFTKNTPKSSYKIKLPKSARFVGMGKLNLKSMWNDPSQMREALAWEVFREAEVPASRHAYAKLCINDRYYGLYSVIEEVDKPFLKDRFGDLDEGNLYQGNWSDPEVDLGPADLAYRGDEGSDYFHADDLDDRSYKLETNDDAPELAGYDDLARFVRVLNGKELAEGAGFDSPAFEQSIEQIFDVRGFLRWACVNVLLGAWDNYYRTPGNYFLYNAGREEDGDFVAEPYFHWLPWDYDHSLGIDRFGTPWHKTGLVDWQKHTASEHGLPLIENLLKNRNYLGYYLDQMECTLDRSFHPSWVEQQIGKDSGGPGLWPLIRVAAYLESDSQSGAPHTGRKFTNDQVYWNGFRHDQLSHDGAFILGIWHHVNARHDNARAQIAWLREEHGLAAGGCE